MTERERYEALLKRADMLNKAVARIEGERQVYIQQLQSRGFKNKQQVVEYINKVEEENKQKQQRLVEQLDEFEKKINEAEALLGVNK